MGSKRATIASRMVGLVKVLVLVLLIDQTLYVMSAYYAYLYCGFTSTLRTSGSPR
jgi:hypothetical protein